MRIAFLVKYYYPFERGGSEQSTRDLAVSLIKRNHHVIIITPNFGSKNHDEKDGVEIIRMPFPIKLKNRQKSLAPFWTNNILWFLGSTMFLLYIILRKKISIIHIQNNEFLPAGFIASKFLFRKSVVTFRDYQSLCNLGFCFWKSDKACPSLNTYLKEDFNFFYGNYVNRKNYLKHLLMKFAAVRGCFWQKLLYSCAKRIDVKVAVSQKVAQIFETNGITINKVIHNVVSVNTKPSTKESYRVTYVGRLSHGKGVNLLIQIIPNVLRKLKNIKFQIVGSGYLQSSLLKLARRYKNEVNLKGQLDHAEVNRLVNTSALVVIPSVWPEPLPRSAIEAILNATPVVATNVGGIREVVKDKIYGRLTKPDPKDLEKNLILAFNERKMLKANLLKDQPKLQKHFSIENVLQYENLYRRLQK